MESQLFSLLDKRSLNSELVGGKAANLARAISVGARVPRGFIIPWDCRNMTGDDLRQEIATSAKDLNSEYVAVRSSATVEDGNKASWAGQFDTFLGTPRGEIYARVQSCWESFNTENAQMYEAASGSTRIGAGMPVLVQEMVPADYSGVLFTVEPVSRDRHIMALEVVAGLGETLVHGNATPQGYTVDRSTGRFTLSNPHRQTSVLKLTASGLNVEAFDPKVAYTFSDSLFDGLIAMSLKLETAFGGPQDIEFCYVGTELFILQSRPITTLQDA